MNAQHTPVTPHKPVTALSSRRLVPADPEAGRPTTIKFAMDDFAVLEAMAFAQGGNVSEQIRVALRDYFLTRLRDPHLPEQISQAKKRIAEQNEALLTCLDESVDPSAVPTVPVRKQDPTKNSKSHTLRLEAGTINRLTALSLVEPETTLADHVRTAVSQYIRNTVEDPDGLVQTFQHAKSSVRAFSADSSDAADATGAGATLRASRGR